MAALGVWKELSGQEITNGIEKRLFLKKEIQPFSYSYESVFSS